MKSDFSRPEKNVRLLTEKKGIPCDLKKATVVSADDSPNKKYFTDLLKRGLSAPLSDFLKPWYPSTTTEPGDDSYIFKCQKHQWGALYGVGETLAPACRPDTLYSWGNRDRLKVLQKSMPDGKNWGGEIIPAQTSDSMNAYYLSVSAVSTFGYGDIAVRAKIRPGTQFVDPDKWGLQAKSIVFNDNAVGYRTWDDNGLQDFWLHDPHLIESWSYGTPQIYDEIVRDALRIASGKPAIKYEKFEPKAQGLARIYYSKKNWDGHIFSENLLKMNLMNLIRMILSREGRIYYAEDACRNEEDHYATDKPTYINPHGQP